MKTTTTLIDQVKTLPPAPRILPDLLAVLKREDSDADDVVRLISMDPALTALVLRRCNSAANGFAGKVQSIQQAVMHVGASAIYRIVAFTVGERLLGADQAGYGIAQGELWKHSLVTALGAQVIARKTGEDQSCAFTSALLHDIGKLVLDSTIQDIYADVLRAIETTQVSFLEAEKNIIGADHAEVGGSLLERWQFPESLVRAVLHHHDPAQAETYAPLTACVHLGDVLAHMLGHGYGHQSNAVRCQPDALDILRLTSNDLEQLMIATAAEAEAALSPKPFAA